MAGTFMLWNIGGVMVSGVMLFVWFHKNLSFHPMTDMIP